MGFFSPSPQNIGTASYWLVAINPRVSSLKSAMMFPFSSSSSSSHLCLVTRRSPGICCSACWVAFPPVPSQKEPWSHAQPRTHTHDHRQQKNQRRRVVPGASDASPEPAAHIKLAAKGSGLIPCPQVFSDAIGERKKWKKIKKKNLLSVIPDSFHRDGQPCSPPGVTYSPTGLHSWMPVII